MTPVTIDGKRIGPGARCYVIAEAGVNHNGNPELAHRLVDAAADAGADAVKFQTFRPELLASENARTAQYQQRAEAAQSQLAMLRALVLPLDAYPALRERARARGISFLSTPFDRESVDFLTALGVPALKISSADLTNPLLLRHAAQQGLPLILSTGMARLDEVQRAMAVIREVADVPVVVLQCVSSYPAQASEANLRAIATMQRALEVPIGFSDHTLDPLAALAAVAVGACLIEKHLTLDTGMTGPDHLASADPAQFATLVRQLRHVESMLGDGVKVPTAGEAETAVLGRRSLHWNRSLGRDEIATETDLIALRPAGGIPPEQWRRFVGRPLRRAVKAGDPVALDDMA